MKGRYSIGKMESEVGMYDNYNYGGIRKASKRVGKNIKYNQL